MKKIGIIGLGLIGGSLAKRLKKKYADLEIVAMNRSLPPLQTAQAENTIDDYASEITDLFTGCNIVFVCTPVDKICGFVRQLLPYLHKDCIITDVGSTKSGICREMEGYPVHFIGGHPMAGSEKTGYEASKDYLFENAYYILTPPPDFPVEKLEYMKAVIHALGAMPVLMTPEAHDQAVAAVSHAPHVIAAALVSTVERLDQHQHMHNLAAGGFRDITRIASGSPDMWYSISMENSAEIHRTLAVFRNRLDYFEEKCMALDGTAVRDFFQDAKDYRDSFSMLAGPGTVYELRADVEDRPGIIAEVATLLSVNQINIKNIGIINSREYENGVLQIVFDTQEAMDKSKKLLQQRNFHIY